MIVKVQAFRVKATSETFEVDDFDWGQCDEYGEQYLTFFRDGQVVCQLLIEEVHEITRIMFPQPVSDKLREDSQNIPGLPIFVV
jgi:hypothetical protein